MLTVIDNTTPSASVKGSTLLPGDTVATPGNKFLVVNIGSLILIPLEGDSSFNSAGAVDPAGDYVPVTGVLTLSA